MDRRSLLRKGRRHPGPAGHAFSMEDVGFQRLHLGVADAEHLTPATRTGSAAAAHGTTFAISASTDTATYSSATVEGTIRSSGNQPHNAYTSALWTWKIFDILGNPVTGDSPVILQWALVMTDRSATGGSYPYTSGTDPKSWLTIGICSEDADNIDTASRPVMSGFENKVTTNTGRLLHGMADANENMTGEAGISDGKFIVGTCTMGPLSDGTVAAGPLATTLYAVKTAGDNTYAGQEIDDSRNYPFDTGSGVVGLELAPSATTQLNWMLALGRLTLSTDHSATASDTSGVEWRFRIYGRAIPAIMYSEHDATWRNFAKTWV